MGDRRRGLRLRDTVHPSPATHAISAQLKAGETVYQAGELPETLRVPKIHYEPPKTVCKAPFASIFPPSMENGERLTRFTTATAGSLGGMSEAEQDYVYGAMSRRAGTFFT